MHPPVAQIQLGPHAKCEISCYCTIWEPDLQNMGLSDKLNNIDNCSLAFSLKHSSFRKTTILFLPEARDAGRDVDKQTYRRHTVALAVHAYSG